MAVNPQENIFYKPKQSTQTINDNIGENMV